jgi:hypothetical protein
MLRLACDGAAKLGQRDDLGLAPTIDADQTEVTQAGERFEQNRAL